MKKAIPPLIFLLIILAGCKQEPIKPFCGDNICQGNEKEGGCAADCGGFEGITKLQCANSNGKWNECGSPCAGTGAEFCIQLCSPQCECGGIAGFKCPPGYKCRLSGKTAGEIGVCVTE